MKLNQIPASKGARQKPTRVGRGRGSGHGKTASYGQKGQRARSGGVKRPGFTGGQTPLSLRFPKRGFNKPNRKEWAIVNLEQLDKLQVGSIVDAQSLLKAGVIREIHAGLRVLGKGELSKALTVKAAHFSTTAKAKIEKAGGTAEVAA
jgi:large subunit ribosomal protein L15